MIVAQGTGQSTPSALGLDMVGKLDPRDSIAAEWTSDSLLKVATRTTMIFVVGRQGPGPGTLERALFFFGFSICFGTSYLEIKNNRLEIPTQYSPSKNWLSTVWTMRASSVPFLNALETEGVPTFAAGGRFLQYFVTYLAYIVLIHRLLNEERSIKAHGYVYTQVKYSTSLLQLLLLQKRKRKRCQSRQEGK